jgi:hypothetical protein
MQMKSPLVAALIDLIVFTASAQAVEITDLDRMSDDDQIAFVDQLAQSVEDATTGDLHTRVHRFFMPKQPGEVISGMGQFEINLSMARIADLEAVAKNPKARRLEVEDVLYVTMERNGIVLPHSFRPSAVNFRPKVPNAKSSLTLAQAQKELEDTKAWVSRTVVAPHTFRPGSGPTGPALTDSQKGIAFFAALIALAAANAGSADSSPSSYPYDSHEADPWWVRSGFNSYHDAVRSACVNAHNGNSGSC